MDFSIDFPVQFGPVQLTAVLVCVVGLGASLIHAVGQYWAASRNLRLGLEHKKSTLKSLGVGFAVFLTILGLDVVGEFPWPDTNLTNMSANTIIGWGSVLTFLALVVLIAYAWSKHSSHHNH